MQCGDDALEAEGLVSQDNVGSRGIASEGCYFKVHCGEFCPTRCETEDSKNRLS
jgi:hypothetical protein